MSAKIYNGYKIDTISLKELYDFSITFRDKCRKVSEKIAECVLIRSLFVEKVGRELNILKDENKSVWGKVYWDIAERQRKIKKSGVCDPVVDFDTSWVFIPLEKYTICTFYSEQPEINDLWRNEKLVNFYGYWNNTDPDESCSEEEWKQRERDWDVIGYEPFSNAGFSFSVYVDYNMPPKFYTRDELTPEVISKYFDRTYIVNHWIRNIILSEILKETNEIRFVCKSEMEEYIKKNKEFYGEIVNQVESVVKEKYTIEDFIK